MKTPNIRKFLFFLIFMSLNAETQAGKKPVYLDIDQLTKTVVNLRGHIKPNVDVGGTGCFIVKEKENRLFLVTAQHVAKDMDSNAYVILPGENDSSIKLDIRQLVYPVQWKHHAVADVSVLELKPQKGIRAKYLASRFVSSDVIDTAKRAISPESRLTVLGFSSENPGAPLTYRSSISGGYVTLRRFDIKTPQAFIKLGNPNIALFGGAPVYELDVVGPGNTGAADNGSKLIGFIHGALSDSAGSISAAMTPSFYIAELLH
jgi:hypothetical protein